MYEFSRCSEIRAFNMTIELIITNVFRLSDGTTVLACEGKNSAPSFIGRQAMLMAEGEVKQSLSIAGERLMFNKTSRENECALETRDKLLITLEEAQSKRFKLVLS